MGSLAVSRSIGDAFFKCEKYTGQQATGLTAEPHIACAKVGEGDPEVEFLIIGCDGLWDAVTYQEAANFVLERLRSSVHPEAISEALVTLARDKGSSDNITVIVASW